MIELYIKLLQEHDWDYEFSSDHRQWSKGNAERMELNRMRKEYDPNYHVWNSYCDYEYVVHGDEE